MIKNGKWSIPIILLFQILRTKNMNFETLQIMNRFAKFWDLYANSGSFKRFVSVLREKAALREDKSFFWEFYSFNEFLTQRYSPVLWHFPTKSF